MLWLIIVLPVSLSVQGVTVQKYIDKRISTTSTPEVTSEGLSIWKVNENQDKHQTSLTDVGKCWKAKLEDFLQELNSKTNLEGKSVQIGF
jgi:ACT domain-containing protein